MKGTLVKVGMTMFILGIPLPIGLLLNYMVFIVILGIVPSLAFWDFSPIVDNILPWVRAERPNHILRLLSSSLSILGTLGIVGHMINSLWEQEHTNVLGDQRESWDNDLKEE